MKDLKKEIEEKYEKERQLEGMDLLAQGYNLKQINRILDRKYPITENRRKG